MLANHLFWRLTSSTLTFSSCCNFQSCRFLLLLKIIIQGHCESEFSANIIFHKSEANYTGYPTMKSLHDKISPTLKELPRLAHGPTYHINVIKLKWDIMWPAGYPT